MRDGADVAHVGEYTSLDDDGNERGDGAGEVRLGRSPEDGMPSETLAKIDSVVTLCAPTS
jgi:hypothetical protein